MDISSWLRTGYDYTKLAHTIMPSNDLSLAGRTYFVRTRYLYRHTSRDFTIIEGVKSAVLLCREWIWVSSGSLFYVTSHQSRELKKFKKKITERTSEISPHAAWNILLTSPFMTFWDRDQQMHAFPCHAGTYECGTVETLYSTIPYTTIFYITWWIHGPPNLQRPIRTLIVLLGFGIKQIFV